MIELMPPSLEPWAPTRDVSRQVAVMMSGGVDSSVTANWFKQAGWDVLGITMKIPVACDTGKRGCCGADAAFVCHELGLPHYFVDVTQDFRETIIEPFQKAYAQGQTPNPCIDCNTILKFQRVWDLLERAFDIRYVATGHYARVTQDPDQGKFSLCRGHDPKKDQSYFLYGVPAHRLPFLLLPLGDLTKGQVREQAKAQGLCVADKPESMELCFAGEGDYREALDERANAPGDLLDMEGLTIGRHKGISHYTLGQRKGIGYAGGQPLYVGRIDANANTVSLGTREQVCTDQVFVDRLNILDPEALSQGQVTGAKIRSYGTPYPCRVTHRTDTTLEIQFETPQFAPSPGQRLVIYGHQDQVVAGGVIIKAP